MEDKKLCNCGNCKGRRQTSVLIVLNTLIVTGVWVTFMFG